MESILYNKIKAKAKEICSDYDELHSDYCAAISALKTDTNIVKIFQLESLLKEKNQMGCAYAIYKGYILENSKINIENLYDDDVLFERGLDETVGIKELSDSEQYCQLDNEIANVTKEITNLFRNNLESIDILIDRYDNYNCELLRAAYMLGCEFKLLGKLILSIHK